MDFAHLPRELQRKIYFFLPPTSQKACRLICRGVNELFQSSREILQDFALIMDGSAKDENMGAALLFTTTPWTCVKFINGFDISEFLDVELAFVTITNQLGPSIRSLTLSGGCRLSLGRFMEFLSFLPSLADLHLEDMGALYESQNAVQLLNWKDFIIPFECRLRSLRSLSLVEPNSQVLEDDRTAWYMINNTKVLRSLKIHTSPEEGHGFPKDCIVRTLERCAKTLRDLDISGNDRPMDESDETLWEAMSTYKVNLFGLQTLTVDTICMGSFEGVVTSLRNLTSLELKRLWMSYTTFLDIGRSLPCLTTLIVMDSLLTEGVLNLGFQNAGALKRVKLSGNETESGDEALMQDYIQFFHLGPKSIEDIEVIGADFNPLVEKLLKEMITPDFGNGPSRKLKKLKLSHFDGFQDLGVLPLFIEISESLKSLELSHTDINDTLGTALAGMRALEFLSLANTQVSLSTAEQVMILPKLREVDFTNTFSEQDQYEVLFATNESTITLINSEVFDINEMIEQGQGTEEEETGEEGSEDEEEEDIWEDEFGEL